MPDRGLIVVGVNELGADEKTLRWAAQRAHAGRARLRLVHAYETMAGAGWTPRLRSYPIGLSEQRQAEAQRLLTTAAGLCDRQARGLTIETVAVEGPTVEVLLDESSEAQLLVLGSRLLAGLSSYVLGSIGHAMVQRSPCPVAVVRRDPGARTPRKIVLGLDLDHDCDTLLDFAFEYGQQSGLPVEVVTCWRGPMGAGLELLSDLKDEEQSLVEVQLGQRLAPWQDKYPEVEATALVSQRWPIPGLLERAGDLNPLILGRRSRHPALTGIGSIHLSALHHATGPVIIVPTDHQR